MSGNTNAVDRLKAEGTAFFVQKQYKEAIAKYSQAIDRDPKNAILFANRAACYQGLKRYGKAELDAKQATQLDETYPKAWARLAAAQAAMSQHAEALSSWRRALNALPNENPSPADLAQRQQYEASASASEKKLQRPDTKPSNEEAIETPGLITENVIKGGTPWQRAKAIEPRLERQGIIKSSVYTILIAYESFMEGERGIRTLKLGKKVGNIRKDSGNPRVIESLSNAVLTDSRAIHISGLHNWVQRYHEQVRFEEAIKNAPDSGKPMEEIIAHARRLKQEGGWEAVRLAVTVSVRNCVIYAFFQSKLMHDDVEAVIALDRALEILRWGRAEWPDASYADRGVIFKDTFVRGVRAMRLESYMNAFQSVGDRHGNYRFSINHVYDEAEGLLEDLRTSQENEARSYMSERIAFFDVPEAQALVAKGFFCMRSGIAILREAAGDRTKGVLALQRAHEFYYQGAEKYPADDERRPYFLAISLLALFRAGAALDQTLRCIVYLREARDAAKEIWENLPSFRETSALVDKYLVFLKQMQDAINTGRITLKDVRCPSWASLKAAENIEL